MQNVDERFIDIPLQTKRNILASVELADDLNNSIILDIICDDISGEISFNTIRYELGGDYAPFEMFNLFRDIYNHRYSYLFSSKSVQSFITALNRAEKHYIKEYNKSFFAFIKQSNFIIEKHKKSLEHVTEESSYSSENMIETIAKSNRVHLYILLDVASLEYTIESFVKYFCQYYDIISDESTGRILVTNNRAEERELFVDSMNNQPVICYNQNFIELITEVISKKRILSGEYQNDKFTFLAIELPKTCTFDKILKYFNEHGKTTTKTLRNLLNISINYDTYESQIDEIKSLPICITDFIL